MWLIRMRYSGGAAWQELPVDGSWIRAKTFI
jgi:hypothetical protein